jgi:uncharacterized GH25 family protein
MPALLVAAVLILLPGAVRAHDFWLERAGDGYALRYGHAGGESLPIDPAKVKSIRCVEGTGAARDVRGEAIFEPTAVKVGGRCGAISAFHDGGFISLTPDGEKPLPRTQVPDAVKAWVSRGFAKWVDVRAPAAQAPIGDELEIVPVTSLAKAREGDKVAIRVLLQGKPVAGAVVAVHHRPIGETDSQGVTRLRLRGAGVQSIAASLRRPLATPEADALVLEASLTFEVGK